MTARRCLGNPFGHFFFDNTKNTLRLDWIENVDEARLEEMEGGDDHTGNEDDDLPDIPLKKPKLDL